MIWTEPFQLGPLNLVHILIMTRPRHLIFFFKVRGGGQSKGQGHTLNIVVKPSKQDKIYLNANYNAISLLNSRILQRLRCS